MQTQAGDNQVTHSSVGEKNGLEIGSISYFPSYSMPIIPERQESKASQKRFFSVIDKSKKESL